MKQILINCFYDGMTVSEAIDFIERAYQEKVSARSLKAAQSEIKNCANKEWK